MVRKRNKLEIMKDILSVIGDKVGGIKPTHILYKSNLSHNMMEDYLKELLKKKFIKVNKVEDKRTFFITERGRLFLEKYKTVNEFMESFGLD